MQAMSRGSGQGSRSNLATYQSMRFEGNSGVFHEVVDNSVNKELYCAKAARPEWAGKARAVARVWTRTWTWLDLMEASKGLRDGWVLFSQQNRH